ncbi:MAG: hypothetical protein DRP02_08760 [Candidatus Gerdarchaeota archaeon]|nr:MAG: hypothetical protein DRO63_00560 [Candidatus Gerdarchaeota archaeon]RLI70121.1 MAG: hypothetical protein DRP02_08760 [Candidatus Gerdarchaeota archaeon]
MPAKNENHEIEKQIPQKAKGKKEDPQLMIGFNKWGMLFMFLFVAILGYLILAPIVYIPPFAYNVIESEYIINDLLLTILGILALLFLGLGIYFGWMKKEIPEEKSEEESSKPLQGEQEQITFTFDEND